MSNKNTNFNSNIKKTSECNYSSDGKSFAIFSERTIDFFMKKNNLDINDIYVQAMLTGCCNKNNKSDNNDKNNKSDKNDKSDYMDVDIETDYVETDYMDVDIEME